MNHSASWNLSRRSLNESSKCYKGRIIVRVFKDTWKRQNVTGKDLQYGSVGETQGNEQSGRTFVILNIDIILFKTHFWDAREILFSLVAYKSHIKKKMPGFHSTAFVPKGTKLIKYQNDVVLKVFSIRQTMAWT